MLNWERWCRTASLHIRFKPDRAAVEAELLAHLEDKAEVLRQSGLSQERAAEQALASMGDADEVGRQLAAVHKPWLGYLWLWSRRALVVSLVVMLLLVSERFGSGALDLSLWNTQPRWWQGREAPGQVVELSPDCRDESDGCTIKVPAASVWYDLADHSNGSAVEEMVTLYFTIEAAGQAGTVTAFRDFYAVDDLGNTYPSMAEYDQGTNAYLTACVVWMTTAVAGPFRSVGKGSIGFLDPEASWVELRYDREGRDIRLRIDLTGGEAA